MWEVKSMYRRRGQHGLEVRECVFGYSSREAMYADGWELWYGIFHPNGRRRFIGKAHLRGKNWRDVASAEAARRNALLD